MYKTISHLDITQAGLIAGISGFIGETLQLFFGYYSDRGHRKKIMMLGLSLASCILWVTFTSRIGNCFALLLLLMIGSGSFHPSAAGFTSILSQERKGHTILLFASGGAIGLAISQLAFSKLIGFFNGHALILFFPVVLLLLVLSRYSFSDQQNAASFSFKDFIAPFLHCRRSLLLLFFTQVVNFTLFTAFIFLLPDLMHVKKCHS